MEPEALRPDAFLPGMDGRRGPAVGSPSPTSSSRRLEDRSHPPGGLQSQRRRGNGIGRRRQRRERGRLLRQETCAARSSSPTAFWRECRNWRSRSMVRQVSSATCPTRPRHGRAWITTVVRWGHLDARQPSGFAFMVSRQTAEALRVSLAKRRKRHSECPRESGRRPWPLDGRDRPQFPAPTLLREKSSIAAISITNVRERTITEADASPFLNPRACWRI